MEENRSRGGRIISDEGRFERKLTGEGKVSSFGFSSEKEDTERLPLLLGKSFFSSKELKESRPW